VRAFVPISFFLACAPFLALLMLGQSGLAPMLAHPAWAAATLRTLLIAEASVPIALLLGVPAALALWRARCAPRRIVTGVCALPILTPPSWAASGLQFFADRAGLPDAHVAALIAAHAAPAASLAFLVLYGFMNLADPILLRAALASGASPLRAWQLVVLPHLAIAIAVAAAAAFAASVSLTIVDAVLAPALHPTLGTMLIVAVHTADSQTAPAALVLALLALAPLALVWCLSVLKRI
jgi:ABC-type spermidine/putrescine transport system permease subunit II